MNVAIDTDFLVRLNIAEHPGRPGAVLIRDQNLDAGNRFGLTPQVLAEFIHIVTDPRRFERPLAMDTALNRAEKWWNAAEVVHLLPTSEAVSRFLAQMRTSQLGRKRILDTLLASTCLASGVTHLITGNAADYQIFPGLTLIEI
ncbi:MAG: hypothetical protein SFU85_08125 [Candidatus Methylacidiphilales bacterium]|nr:hypothetical protein [Candidatus Methylacidiphilales bacterium]